MLILLALPVIIAVAAMHRYLQTYAPTNLLVRRVRAQAPRWRTAAVLIVLATALLLAMHALGEAIANGAPGWLNPLVLVLAWDAIKFVVVSGQVTVRLLGRAIRAKSPFAGAPRRAVS
jgi:hypothetical protein